MPLVQVGGADLCEEVRHSTETNAFTSNMFHREGLPQIRQLRKHDSLQSNFDSKLVTDSRSSIFMGNDSNVSLGAIL